jgi:hypothetical protein
MALVVLALTLAAAGRASAAGAKAGWTPRLGAAMGIVPAPGVRSAVARAARAQAIPVVYHGGPVMAGGVQIHAVFWAPAGYSFTGSPGGGVPGYEATIERFLAAAAHDSGAVQNVFSVLDQYPDSGALGSYELRYSTASDLIADRDPYPPAARRCVSPVGLATCITDVQVAAELRRVIARDDPAGATLHDIWLMFLPASVDECVSPGQCGSNTFAGYHALAPGSSPLVYAVIIDPMIELAPLPGADPEGNPDAESAVDTVAHEIVEAISDPEGTAWMDPNGFEVADKCESGPQYGTPLGYAPDGSPFNQLIDGEPWLVQEMWSNAVLGCVQRSSATLGEVHEPEVYLRQFSPRVRGSDGDQRAGVAVRVLLLRAGHLVASAAGVTGPGGVWGTLTLRGRQGAPHGVGDDRDVLVVRYGRGGPPPEVIATGSGGNPFTESGFTGWGELDSGYRVGAESVQIAPCFQVGLLTLRLNATATAPPVMQCNGDSDSASIHTGRLGAGAQLTLTSVDNRAPSALDPSGALVSMTIALGQPGARGSLTNHLVPFTPSGQPTCTANLSAQTVSCAGLVPRARYVLERARGAARRVARAGRLGTISVGDLPGDPAVRGGDVLKLIDAAGRTLTALHVARLRVVLDGDRRLIASGTCQPGDYYGAPPKAQPTSAAVGVGGIAGSGRICPADGSARGLAAGLIQQRDDLSGGYTVVQVPLLTATVPAANATVYGAFTALARGGAARAPGAHRPRPAPGVSVSLSIAAASSGEVAFRAADVDRARGVAVPALAPGVYRATWVLRDANGDRRVVRTLFVEQG